MPEPLHRQLSQEHPQAFAIGIHDVLTGPPYEGELGEGLLLRTDRGDIQAILHQAPEAQYGVIWVGGARGGFGRPGQGAYARLADVLRRDRISSLRLCYRHPNVLPECALDVMAGIAYLTHGHVQPVVLVGHSFGGAVVMTAGALHAHGLCRKIAFSRQNPKVVCWKINDLRVQTFLFSVICDRAKNPATRRSTGL